MWRLTGLVATLVCVYVRATETDLLGLESSESSSSPLAQLLATAAGSGAALLPLAPEHFRSKRKPQRFLLNGGERPRFKPRKEEPAEPEEVTTTEAPKRKQFSGFSRRGSRPNPSRFQPTPQTTEAVPVETVIPTEAPKFQLEEFFGTERTEVDLLEKEALAAIPVALTNSIVEEKNILEEVRARTIAITGAQPVGVTKDVSHRSKGGRQLQGSRPRGGRRPVPQRQQARPEVGQEDPEEERDGNSLASGPKRGGERKSNHIVGTVERYRYENEDGSITWGYENEDGSYKEELIGVDCVTRGKYGYIDPTGEVREYTYTGGVRCDPETRQLSVSDESQKSGANGHGFFDYAQNKFVMPDGRRVRVVVNQGNKARGRRY